MPIGQKSWSRIKMQRPRIRNHYLQIDAHEKWKDYHRSEGNRIKIVRDEWGAQERGQIVAGKVYGTRFTIEELGRNQGKV